MTIRGTSGDDVLTGTSGDDAFNLTQGGNDTASGGGGDDVFWMGATLTAADKIDGGIGIDTVTLNGDYSAGLVFAADTVVNVEQIFLAAGHDYNLTMNDGNVAAGERLTIRAGSLGAADHLIFDGSAELDGHFTIVAGAGDDMIAGGAKSDRIQLDQGGADTVHAGGGADVITMGGALTAADQIDGGTGDDLVVLNGDYSGGLIFTNTTMTNVETLRLLGDHSYNLTPALDTVALGLTMTVDASALGAGHALTLHAPGTFGIIDVIGSAGDDFINSNGSGVYDFTLGGNDTVIAGSNSINTFYLGAAFTASDQLNGGRIGTMYLDGDYAGAHAVVFTATTMINVENLTLAGGHSYDLTLNADTVAAHQQLRVFANGLLAGNSLTFDGSATTDGVYQFNAGAGTYSLTGGGNNDQFNMGASFTASDHVNGGSAGDDTLDLNGDYSGGLVFGAATMINIQDLQLSGGHSYDLTTNEATVAAGVTLAVDASTLHAGDTLTFNASAETDGFFAITGGAGDDTVTIASPSTLAGSTFEGGGGANTLVLDGDFSSGFTFGAATMTDVGTLSLVAGHSYNLTTDDANVASGTTLTVDASTLGAGDTLIFNGSAETDGNFTIIGGAGSDTLTGGAGADTFVYNAVSDSTGSAYDTIHSLDFASDLLNTGAIGALPSAIDAAVINGALSTATFDGDLATAIGAGQLGAQHAVLFTPDAGTLSGETFLIVDENGAAGYQAGADLVIDVTGFSGSLTVANFI